VIGKGKEGTGEECEPRVKSSIFKIEKEEREKRGK
jgi:hypothetical protein